MPAVVIGPNSAGAGADDASFGAVAWTNPGNILAAEDTPADCDVGFSPGNSHYLVATDFGFALDAALVVVGVAFEARVRGFSTQITTARARLVKGGVIGSTDLSDSGQWATTFAYRTFGSASALWGETLTPADVNAADFGFALAANVPNALNHAYVDHVRATVYYAAGGGRIGRASRLGRKRSLRRP